MRDHGQRVCIVTENADLGESLRNTVQNSTLYSCTVLSSLVFLQSLGRDQPIAVVFLDRSLEIEGLENHSGLLDHLPVATFGKAAYQSVILNDIESTAQYQLRHPLQATDVQRLLDHLTNPGQGKWRADSRLPLHGYKDLAGDSNSALNLGSTIQRRHHADAKYPQFSAKAELAKR